MKEPRIPEGFAEAHKISGQLLEFAKALRALRPKLAGQEPAFGVMLEASSSLAAMAGAALVSPNSVPTALLAAVVATRIFEDESLTSEESGQLVKKMLDKGSRERCLKEMALEGVDHYLASTGAAN